MDPRGFLWVASDTGLYQFDGQHFHRFDARPALAVQTTSDGWVWVSRKDGLFCFRAGEEKQVLRSSTPELLSNGVTIAAAGEHLWRGTAAGLREYAVKPNGGLVADAAFGFWFACSDEVCELNAEGKLLRHQVPGSDGGTWLGAARDDQGNMWAWSPQTTVRFGAGRDPVFYAWPGMSGATALRARLYGMRRRSGTVEITTGASIRNGQLYLTRQPLSGPPADPRQQEDAYGGIWQANIDGPLTLLSAKTWIRGWANSVFPNGCHAISRAGDRLLAACASGIYEFAVSRKADGDEWKPVPGAEAGGPAWAASALSDGGIWSIFASRGVIRLDRKGRETEAAWRGLRAKDLDFRTLFRDAAGTLWVGAKAGLFRLNEGAGQLEREDLPGGEKYATAFARSPDGHEWLGFEGGIARHRNGRWETVVPASALLDSRLRSVAVGMGPVFWVAYRDKLPFSRVEMSGGGWKRRDFAASSGYEPDETRSLLLDRRGWVWRSSPEGVFVSDGVHLERHDWLEFRAWNNLPGDSTGAFAFFEDRDGTVWAATDGGVAQFRPDRDWFAPEKHRPPRVSAVRWHGRELLWPNYGVHLAGAGGDLQIDFAQWPDASPLPPALRYRLAPLETEWRWGDTGTAYYSNLKAGSYRFEVRAREAGVTVFPFDVTERNPWLWPLTLSTTVMAMATFFFWRLKRSSSVTSQYWREKEAFLAVQALQIGVAAARSYAGETLCDRYEIEEEIGEGGFASVWKGRDIATDLPVAVKFLKTEGEIESWQISRFEKEAEALERIEHQGVVKLLDSGRTCDGTFWLAMAWIDGPSLRTALKAGPVERGKAADWIGQMGAAMGEAHARGVLHRDLKPENILIEHWGRSDERVVVVDFGAAGMEGAAGQSSMHLGSFDYMAPERVQGRSSRASDVYGLAAIAFEMLTGVRFAGVAASSAEGMARLLAGFPEAVATVLAEGLTYQPEDRPCDIGSFAERLATAVSARD